jgi:hypothetical protein
MDQINMHEAIDHDRRRFFGAAALTFTVVALSGRKATSRAKGSRRKLRGLVSDRQRRVRGTVRIGKARSRSR